MSAIRSRTPPHTPRFSSLAGIAFRHDRPRTVSFATLHGLYWLLNNLTRERPMVLCIDDLQWADPETVRFLGYLAPRLDGLPLAVVASVRPQSNVTADMARLLAAPEAITLRPGPLSVEATAVLCERELGAAVAQEFAAACHGATGGNPFFLQTLLREARELRYLTDASQVAQVRRIGPAAVARAVLLRLATAPAAVTALVRAISVLGDAASVLEAARLADLDDDAAARAADLLVELAILRRAEGLEFAHPIVRSAIYEHIGSHERARMHARAARMLSERDVTDERIAAQIMKSEPSGEPWRIERLRRVAARALAQGAPAAALTWLTRALAESPLPGVRSELLLELGTAELRLGMPEALGHLRDAVAGVQQSALLATAARQLANAYSNAGNSDGCALRSRVGDRDGRNGRSRTGADPRGRARSEITTGGRPRARGGRHAAGETEGPGRRHAWRAPGVGEPRVRGGASE